MREFVKVSCVLLFMFAAPATAVVWTDDRPTDLVRALQAIFPVLAVMAIAVFLKIHFRRDLVPDYLSALDKNYFNRGGFCFCFSMSAGNGICYLHAWFQNQTDRPCRGRIALRPGRDFFFRREQIVTFGFDIACEPAAFGVATVAIPLPEVVQGTRQAFEVGASVDYPQGKGRRLRFRDGLHLRTNSDFGNALVTTFTVLGAMTGSIVLSKPATVVMVLPLDVAASFSKPPQQEVVTMWRLGDLPTDPPWPKNQATRTTTQS